MSTERMAERKYVSATQLAAVATCEKRVLLAKQRGAHTTPAQRASMCRGISLHARVARMNDMDAVRRRRGPLDRLCRVARALIQRALKATTRLFLRWGAMR